jgi:hypothetical protein
LAYEPLEIIQGRASVQDSSKSLKVKRLHTARQKLADSCEV